MILEVFVVLTILILLLYGLSMYWCLELHGMGTFTLRMEAA
jgi:hypothetical protein